MPLPIWTGSYNLQLTVWHPEHPQHLSIGEHINLHKQNDVDFVMLFWNARSFLLVDHLPSGNKISGQYHADLTKLRKDVTRKGWITHTHLVQDNASSHGVRSVQLAAIYLKIQFLSHLPYFLGFVPWHLFSFSKY